MLKNPRNGADGREMSTRASRVRRKRASVVLLVSMGLMVAGMGAAMGLDLSRLYMAKRTAKFRADAAALAAVMELDGTHAGLERAREVSSRAALAAHTSGNPASGLKVEFSTHGGAWLERPSVPQKITQVRVTSTVFVPFSLLRTFVPQPKSHAWAVAVAEQRPKVEFEEGLFPYAVLAHNETAPAFGLQAGQLHTLRWPTRDGITSGQICAGDRDARLIARATANGMVEMGYIEMASTHGIRKAVLNDFQTSMRRIGDPLRFTEGMRHMETQALGERIASDPDAGSRSYAEYAARGIGNGRRIVAAPIHSGAPKFTVLQIGAFLLLPALEYREGGSEPFCAEYLGPYIRGGRRKGAGEAGFYVSSLVQ